jgi:hypothetical protein
VHRTHDIVRCDAQLLFGEILQTLRATYINLSSPPRSLLDTFLSMRLTLESQTPLAADLVVWEASEKPSGSLNAEQVAKLTKNIQNGGRILVTLDSLPGLSPLLLGSVLPSTGWATQLRLSPYTPREPLGISRVDPTYFPDGLDGLVVPFCCDIRPTSAVERGQARYERYNFVHPVLHVPVPAASDFWSRTLLNREWTVRAQCNDLTQMPLVVTGRYGAGKVVMVSTSAAGIGESAIARRFWNSVLRSLLEEEDIERSDSTKPGMVTKLIGSEAQVTLSNPGSKALRLEVVVRALSAEGAILADGSGELQRKVLLSPRQSSTLNLPLPTPSPIADDAVRNGKSIRVRVGALSGDGATLLMEHRMVAPQPALQLKIQTDNLYSVAYPFHSPGPDALAAFTGRMGAFVGAYAYAPGQAIRGTVILSNGVTNLAPISSVRDITTPGNISVMALNDEATGFRQTPNSDKIEAYSMWTGKAAVENVLQFTLPQATQITEVVLVGNFGASPNESHNPGSAVIEADDRTVASIDNLDTAFTAGYGQARLAFPPCRARTLTVRFPWVDKRGSIPREAPWLGEICVQGWADNLPPEAFGHLVVSLVDALTGERQPILNAAVTVSSCEVYRRSFEATLPQVPGINFYRLEAIFQKVTSTIPVLMIKPSRALLPLTDLRPVNSPGVGFNVSRGFREAFHQGTGTAEPTPGWGAPDDLIWSYSRQLKQISRKARTEAARLYLTESDMRHYITPWRSFSNGDLFFPVAAPQIVDKLRSNSRWSTSNTVQLLFADRWDTGPDLSNLHGWQDYVEFDKTLRKLNGVGLAGRTHQEIGAEIEANYGNHWQAWQLERYLRSVRSLRDAFQSAGKSLVISAQGVPMVAGEAGRELSRTIRGMIDDCTWSMLDNSQALTTGRQMSELAFNPVWEMSTLIPWGYNSSIFNNWQWHNPVGTAEPSRRHIYDRAWRATLWFGELYASLYKYGFTANAGIAYTTTEEEFQQWWYMQERESLLAPEEPIGAGLVISTAKSADPNSIRFTCGDPLTIDEARLLAQSFRNLHNAGVSLPFAANASTLRNCAVKAPLILLNLPDFNSDELDMLKDLHQRGTRIAAFAEKSSLSPAAAELFLKPGTLLIETSAATLTHSDALKAAARLQAALHLTLRFPQGTAGYGFRSQDTTFLVVEDWLERARKIELQITKSDGAQTASACNVNSHQHLNVEDRGSTWVIEVPLRSGDGVLIALKERFREP